MNPYILHPSPSSSLILCRKPSLLHWMSQVTIEHQRHHKIKLMIKCSHWNNWWNEDTDKDHLIPMQIGGGGGRRERTIRSREFTNRISKIAKYKTNQSWERTKWRENYSLLIAYAFLSRSFVQMHVISIRCILYMLHHHYSVFIVSYQNSIWFIRNIPGR